MGDISQNATARLDDGDGNDPNAIFHPLADELMAIANRLRHAAGMAAVEVVPATSEDTEGRTAKVVATSDTAMRTSRPSRSHLALARKAYALRRKRSAIFGNPDLFGEPAWDILLDLFIAQSEGKTVSVSSACIGSAAPATTGLRWLGVLADEGLVVREADPDDNRRVMVRLTPTGRSAMERFFDAVETG